MLSRRRRDWFPIVATDLFCNVLAAVIILDAVSSKEIGVAGAPVFMQVLYPKSRSDVCENMGVVFAFDDSSGAMLNTIDGGNAAGEEVDGNCVIQVLFPDVVFQGTLNNPRALVTEFAGQGLPKVFVSGPGFGDIQCEAGSTLCPVR